MMRFARACALLSSILILPHGAYAHPHAWIYLESSPVFNEKGEITALRQRWVFDQYYTEFILQDMKVKDRKHPPKEKLLALASENLSNLREYDYFTKAKYEKKTIRLGEVSHIKSELEDKSLAMDFTVAFEAPINPKISPLTYKIFDPSYYVEMLHGSKKRITLPENAPPSCVITRAEAEPSLLQISLANALDKQATAPENLGDIFAETITVHCP